MSNRTLTRSQRKYKINPWVSTCNNCGRSIGNYNSDGVGADLLTQVNNNTIINQYEKVICWYSGKYRVACKHFVQKQ